MNDREDEPSFDPRRWSRQTQGHVAGTGDSVKAAVAPSDEPSFDPRSWSRPTPAPPATIEAEPPVAKPAASEPPVAATPVVASAPRRFVPAAVSATILLAGAATAWWSRPATPSKVAEPARAAVAVPRGAGMSRRTLTLASARDVGATLAQSGAPADQADAAARRIAAALGDGGGHGGGDVRLVYDVGGDPVALSFVEATRDDGSGITLTRRGDGRLSAQTMNAHLTTRIEIVRGELDAESFYSSAVAAGVNDRLIGDFANAFAFDFDMQREVGPGDVFEAGFEQRYNASGEAVGAPVLVYASLTTAAKSRALYRYAAPGDAEASWFDSNGRSTRRALMRTPVDSARITSRFGPRLHPILGFVKLHNGTDFAAPTGTPIYASGDATVEFSGPKGANGNFVRLRHDNGWQTLYLHMNRIWPGVTPGARVAQGQQIGEIGTTGRSTGPHLHYEVHVDGAPVDPMGIDTGTGRSLDPAALVAFRRQRDLVDARRATGA